MATLYSGWIWEGLSTETKPGDVEGSRDGHLFKELDTGDAYSRVSGTWEFANLGLSFIKATKSGRITTDSDGFYHVIFNTPLINDQYMVTLTCVTDKTNILAYSNNFTINGFDIYTKVVPTTPQYHMFVDVASDITDYSKMVLLNDYPSGTLGSKRTSLSNDATLMKSFVTDSGFYGASLFPKGKFICTLTTQKETGSNTYLIWFTLGKRSLDGTETLLATSNLSDKTSINDRVNRDLTAFVSTDVSMLVTDRLVIKIYGRVVLATANVDLIFDGNPGIFVAYSRMELFRESYVEPNVIVSWLATRDYNP